MTVSPHFTLENRADIGPTSGRINFCEKFFSQKSGRHERGSMSNIISGTRNAIGRLNPFKRGAQPTQATPTPQATLAPPLSSSAATANGQAAGNTPPVQEHQGSIQLVNY